MVYRDDPFTPSWSDKPIDPVRPSDEIRAAVERVLREHPDYPPLAVHEHLCYEDRSRTVSEAEVFGFLAGL